MIEFCILSVAFRFNLQSSLLSLKCAILFTVLCYKLDFVNMNLEYTEQVISNFIFLLISFLDTC